HELEKCGVKLMNCTRLEKIEFGRVTVLTNTSSTVPDPYNTWAPLLPDNVPNPLEKPIREAMETRQLEADMLVVAAGSCPNNELYRLLTDNYAAPEIRLIGDAGFPGMITEATRAGYRTGLGL
ncbi:MAG: enoate reductase, partial [Clostridiaceae bacterium]|nr:enoate reductase [Clostridiaceae bacterium]